MMNPIPLSRRDFLKISASGALAFILTELGLDRVLAAPPASQGRITWSGIPLYEQPTFNSAELDLFGIDKVIPLKAQIEGDISYGNPFNNIWYEVEGGGYVFSGGIQPVETNYQKAVYDIPDTGRLAEISVPFSLTHLAPFTYAKTGPRLFYGSTHWVKRVLVTREEKSIWYEIYDKEDDRTFYIPSFNMRIIPDEELTMLSPEIPAADKLIHVDLASQMVTAFEGEKMVFSARCSSGQRGTDTPTGEFSTFHKGPSIHMTNQGDAVQNIYNLPGVPWTSFFTGMGHAFHGTYWHNDYGRPRSHGCINLPSDLSKWIYRWTSPLVPLGEDYLHKPGEGTRVIVV